MNFEHLSYFKFKFQSYKIKTKKIVENILKTKKIVLILIKEKIKIQFSLKK